MASRAHTTTTLRAIRTARVAERRPPSRRPRARQTAEPGRATRPPSTSGRPTPEATLVPSVLAIGRLMLCVLVTAVCVACALLASIGDRQGRRAYAVARAWARLNVWLCRVRIETEGLEHLDPTQTYVFMANHRSVFDVVAMIVALRDYELRWVAKAELGRVPGFGSALRATKQIFVDRRDHARAVATLAAARDRVRNGDSVVFFPEGTRSDGSLLPFKKGGFVFAIETGAPIVPIGISGPCSLVDPRGLLGRWSATVRVVVRPPIATRHCGLDDRDVVLGRVRRAIAGAMNPPRPLFGRRRGLAFET